MEDIAELLVSAETTGDPCGQSWKIGFIGSEPKKWSSLAIAVLMHCVLAVAFYAAGRPQPACRNHCIEVMLIGSLGGTGMDGSTAPPGQAEAGDKTPKAATQEAAPSSSVCPPPEAPQKDEVRKKPAEHVIEKKKCTLPVPLKKPKPELKTVSENKEVSKEKSAEKPVHSDMAESSGKSNPAGEQGMGSGSASGTGQGIPGGLAGRSGNGGGGGMGDVAFGSPNGPRFLRKVVPIYPDFARRQEMQGTVLLRVAIDEQGRVVNIEVLKKAGYGFDEAAVKAIRESTFIPAKNEGKSCSCKALLPIRFQLESADID
jgi:protein TonB